MTLIEPPIARCDQFGKHLFALSAFEVDRQAALSDIEGQKEQAIDARLVAQTRPGDVSFARFLNLGHLGPEPSQYLPTRRAGLVIGRGQ